MRIKEKLIIQNLELLNTASAYNGEQHKAICGKAALELIEYKKIEEELGIDLITLFKALISKTLWFIDYEKTNYGVPFEMNTCDCQFSFNNKTVHIVDDIDDYYFKDYGETWALTKEELL